MSLARSRFTSAAVAALSAAVAVTGLTAPAGAAETLGSTPVVTPAATPSLTTTANNGKGGVVTIDADHVTLGGSLRVTGAGFTADPAHGTKGSPVLAVKINDADFPWALSGPSSLSAADLPGDASGEDFGAIRIEADGTFDVTLTVPADAAATGRTTLRFLGGSMTTDEARLPIQSFSTAIAVLRPTQGFATVTSTAHAQDSVNTAKATVRLRNFRAGTDGLGVSQKVGVKINGAGDILGCFATDANGDTDVTIPLPAKSAVDLPAGLTTFNFLAGTECISGGALTQGPGKNVSATFNLAKSTVTSTRHHPGGKVAVKLEGFMNSAGTNGQKVALKATGAWNSPVLTCVTTDGFGNGTGTFTLPADVALGEITLNALAGSNCGEPGEGDFGPGRSLQATFAVTEQPFAITAPSKVSGTARVGLRLTATAPVFTKPATAVRTQWLRNGTAISGATAPSYTLTAADLGKRISVRHTATHGATTLTSTSPASAAVKAATIVVRKNVTIKGIGRVGKKLSATKVSVATPGVSVKRQWLRNGKAIRKATKSTYKLTKADRKKKISLRVTYTKAGHTTLVRTTKKITVTK